MSDSTQGHWREGKGGARRGGEARKGRELGRALTVKATMAAMRSACAPKRLMMPPLAQKTGSSEMVATERTRPSRKSGAPRSLRNKSNRLCRLVAPKPATTATTRKQT